MAAFTAVALSIIAGGFWLVRSADRSRRADRLAAASDLGQAGPPASHRSSSAPARTPGALARATDLPLVGSATIPAPGTMPGEPTDSPHSTEEVAARLEARFQREASATAAARRIESMMRESIAHAEGVALDRFECRGSMCRARVIFSSRSTDLRYVRQTFLDPTTMLDLDVGVTIPVRNPRHDGSIAATMYIVANGPAAPRPG